MAVSSSYGINSLTKMAMLKVNNVNMPLVTDEEAIKKEFLAKNPEPKREDCSVDAEYYAKHQDWENKFTRYKKEKYLGQEGEPTVNGVLASEWVKGDLDLESLKNLKFNYKEYLRSSNDEMNKVFDNLTVGIRNKLNMFTGKLNKLVGGEAKNNDSQEPIDNSSGGDSHNSKTSLAILDFLAAYTSLTSDEPGEAAEMYANIMGYVQKYNVPVRTQNPSIAIPLDGGLKVNFAWGKAGLFNAEKEVWDPIRKIIGYLSPTVDNDKKFPGLLKLDNVNTIPYNNQTKYLALKGMITKGGKTVSKRSNELTRELVNSGINDAMKAKSADNKNIVKANTNVLKVLGDIAILNPIMLSIASSKLRRNIQDAMYMLCLSFQPSDSSRGTYFFDITQLSKGLTQTTPTYFPLITVTGVPEDIEWGFDYSQVDEKGYPMSGYINIKKIWAVDSFGENFSMDATLNKQNLATIMARGGELTNNVPAEKIDYITEETKNV